MSYALRALLVPLSVTSALALCACGGSDDDTAPVAGASGSENDSGSGGTASGGKNNSGGGSNSKGGKGGDSSGGKGVDTGGKAGNGGNGGSVGGGGKSNVGGSGPIVPTPGCTGEPKWLDITSAKVAELGGMAAQGYPGGVSGVLVNPLNGDVTINIVGFGIWRSDDRGESWSRIDDDVVDKNGGRCETGWGLHVDQDDPTRLASFTLDGSAGYTRDGAVWTAWADSGWGRNWDYGAVDWSTAGAQTIFGVLHETSPSSQYLISTDGGASWSKMDGGRVATAVGVVDANTLLATRTTGIERSTDAGDSWTSVSNITPLGHVFSRYKGKYYITSDDGILVSDDDGSTWQTQGIAIANTKMFQGPYFGADEDTMVVGTQPDSNAFGGGSSIYKTSDGGASWTKIADVPNPGNAFPISLAWYGSFGWDPQSDTYYTSSMSNPVYRLDCTP